jgi:hypothetical protein
MTHLRRLRVAPVLLAAMAAGCAARHGARTAGKGNVEISATVGGPVFHNMGAPIPLPLAHAGAHYGLTDDLDVGGGIHAVAALYGTVGVDVGARYQLWKRSDGAAVAASAVVNAFAGTRDGLQARFFPELGVHGQLPFAGRYLALGGVDTLLQFDPPEDKPPVLAAPYLGVERAVGTRSAVNFTLGWISPWQDSTSVIDYAPGTLGAIAIHIGYRRKLDGGGR